MAKAEKDCCVLTLRLNPEAWQVDLIEKRFKIMEHLKNSLIALELRRLKNAQRTRAYKDLITKIENANGTERKKLYTERSKLLRDAGFSEFGFINDMTSMQKHFVEHMAAQVAHRSASDVWRAFEKMLYGNGKIVHFIRRGTLDSIACKKIGNGMNLRNDYFEWNGGRCKNQIVLSIKVEKPKTVYEKEMLNKKIKYLRIVRKWSKTKYKYYLQITFEGNPATKARYIEYGKRVGIDIGTSTVAIVSEQEVKLLELADQVKKNQDKKISLQQKMDRSKRISNMDNFNADGTIRIGKRLKWNYSKNYLKLQQQVRELERKNAAIRKYQHICLANYVLSQGTEVYVETMSFSGLQRRAKETTYDSRGRINKKRRFGKSLGNRAPAMFLEILDKKLKHVADTELHKVDTQKFKASQYNHITGTYEKKTLRDRWAKLGNGEKVQRDLYSAFLLMNSAADMEKTDQKLCKKTYIRFKELHDDEINRIMRDGKKHIRSFGIA